jgi:hypothetical protein
MEASMSITSRHLAMSLILTGVSGLVGCPSDAPPPIVPEKPPVTTPESAERARLALVAWFECEECEEGQLKAVLEEGDVIVPSLVAALEGGASPASHELLRQALLVRYEEMAAYAQGQGEKVSFTRKEFINHQLGNLDALYRVRAATALGHVDHPSARTALQAASKSVERNDVRAVIDGALKQQRR